MIKHIILALACMGVVTVGHCDPLDKTPRIKRLIEISAPEIYSVKITMDDGRTYEIDKVALSERSLQKRLALNSVDKTMRFVPKGGEERITISVSEISKIEITKTKPEPQPQPEKKPVVAPGPKDSWTTPDGYVWNGQKWFKPYGVKPHYPARPLGDKGLWCDGQQYDSNASRLIQKYERRAYYEVQ